MDDKYIFKSDRMLFKHEVSENIPCDTYSMHIHGSYELLYFIDGDATHVIEDRKYKLKKGDLILIRPFQYHFIQIDSTTRYERYDILFDDDKHGVDGVGLLPDGFEVTNIEGNAVAEDIFRRCDVYKKSCDGETFEKILSHLLSELFYNLHLFQRYLSEERSKLSPMISEALRYTNKNLCTLSGVKEIADHLFVSESYLFRLFQKELHQTPRRYVVEKRLLLAQKMLADGKRATEVCDECGFSDYTTFYRNYCSFFGHAPSVR